MSALSTKKTPLSWVFKGWVVFLNLKREESFGAFHLGMTLDFCQQRGKAGKKGVRLFFCWRPAQHNQIASWGTIPKRRRRGSNRQKAWGAMLASSIMPVSDPIRTPREELMGMGAAEQCQRGENTLYVETAEATWCIANFPTGWIKKDSKTLHIDTLWLWFCLHGGWFCARLSPLTPVDYLQFTVQFKSEAGHLFSSLQFMNLFQNLLYQMLQL